jgi:hypothetical protein
MQKIYSNKDFYLSAYLIAEGYELLEYYRKNGFTTFVFLDTNELQEAIRKFHSLSALTEPVRFGNAIKSLKTLIHSDQISTSNSNNFNEHEQKGQNRTISQR